MNFIRFSQRPLAFFLVSLMLLSTMSCYSRYQLEKSRLPKLADIEGLRFILLDASSPVTNVWLISKAKFTTNTLTARLDRAPAELGQRINAIRSSADKRANQNLVLIYLNSKVAKSLPDTMSTQLEYKNITKIEVFEPDAGKAVLLALGVTAGAILTVSIIVAASFKNSGPIAPVSSSSGSGDCNCPHVYTESPDGTSYLEGSLYSGAIYPTLERGDYLPLKHLQPIDNQYKIRLANQEKQHQHTNFLALEVLDHAPGLQPVFDKYGQIHTLASPQSPLAATNVSGQDVLNEVLAADEKIFLGDLENEQPDATERLTLTFAKPANIQQAKLIINAKNSDWLDYTYFQFQNALGQYADEVTRKRSKLPAAKNLAWAERQKIPLAVWLETRPDHWEKADYFNLVGTSTFRQDVLPLDLSKIQGDIVRVRLEFGFHFWEIDQVALDFSTDQPVQRTILQPVSAIAQNGEDLTTLLVNDDDLYYHQPNIGDEAQITFEAPPLAPNQTRSLVVHAKGHYEIIVQPAPDRPNLFQLKAWDKKNALPRLSRERWRAMTHLVVVKQ